MARRLLFPSFSPTVALLLLFNSVPGSGAARSQNPKAASSLLKPAQITLTGDSISLKDALAKLKTASGIEVHDKRREKTNPRLTLNLKKVTFWDALDVIAREAKVVVSLYQGDGPIALVDGKYRPPTVSYDGAFRTAVKRIVVTRDLDTDTHSCVVYLELAWEPHLEPFFVTRHRAEVAFRNAKGKNEAFAQKDNVELGAGGRSFVEFEVRLPAPSRAVKQLDLLKGALSVVTPVKMLTFTVDSLNKVGAQTKDGVTMRLAKVNSDDDPWDIDIELAYPKQGPRFESYQSWLVNNSIYLEHRRSHVKRRPLGLEELSRVYPHAHVIYHFANTRPSLGKPADWKLVYRTPGRIVSQPVRFSFKDLRLP
jgi:hypothetical protein